MKKMSNLELNHKISEICDSSRFLVRGLERAGIVIPYIGEYWIDVDFSKPVCLGNNGYFTGFMMNNRGNYLEWRTSMKNTKKLRLILMNIIEYPNNEILQFLFDFLQTLKPIGCKK